MSNQAVSVAEDLMVGAGELYFKRSDDTYGWHHLGNVEEFTITNDVTTVEKNSSMNKKRELMASVTTAIEPSASITMNEYNPYNMALGLYGTENVHTQTAKQVVNEVHTIISVPGVIELVDPDGNRYFDVSNVAMGLGTVTPASVAFSKNVSTGEAVGTITANTSTVSTTTMTDDTITDTDGTKIMVNPGTYTGTSTETIYIIVTDGNSIAGQVAGVKVKVQVGAVGTAEILTYTGTSTSASVTGDSETMFTSDGIGVTVTVDSTNLVAPASSAATIPFVQWGSFTYTPAISALTEGVDYIIDNQRLRGGVITIPASSTLTSGEDVKISYNVPEATFPTVSGASAGDIAGELLFLGDPNIGGNYVIEAWKVKVTPDGDFTGLISDDFGSFQLNIKFLADYEHHKDYPFYKATMIGKANGTSSNAGKYDPRY